MMRLLETLTMLLAWADAVEVFVMLGLDAVTQSGDLKDPESLRAQLQQLKSGSADGIMADVWWGATEPSAKSYKFDGYRQLVDM